MKPGFLVALAFLEMAEEQGTQRSLPKRQPSLIDRATSLFTPGMPIDHAPGAAKALPGKKPSIVARASSLFTSGMPIDVAPGSHHNTNEAATGDGHSMPAKRNSISSMFSRSSSASNAGVEAEKEMELRAGDFVESLELITVRSGESLESDTIGELPRGVTLTVQFLGESSRRIKVSTSEGLAGWISLKTRKNQPLVTKTTVRDCDFEVGGEHEVKSIGLTMRALETLDSDSLFELKHGASVKILELGKINRRRAKVQAGDVIGWVSLSTNEGQFLIGKVGGCSAMQDYYTKPSSRGTISFVGPTNENQATRELLEAARMNNLAGVKAKVEGGRKSMLGPAATKVSVNASDVRGKSPLMYAAAFGHVEIVEYLLTSYEINVNGTDDMMKNALHHACKPGGSMGPSIVKSEDSATIIKMLIHAGARIEAKDHNERTAIMLAAQHGAADVVTVLLAAKAEIGKKDENGYTAYDLAVQADWPQAFLERFGADPPRGAGGVRVASGAEEADDRLPKNPVKGSVKETAAQRIIDSVQGSVQSHLEKKFTEWTVVESIGDNTKKCVAKVKVAPDEFMHVHCTRELRADPWAVAYNPKPKADEPLSESIASPDYVMVKDDSLKEPSEAVVSPTSPKGGSEATGEAKAKSPTKKRASSVVKKAKSKATPESEPLLTNDSTIEETESPGKDAADGDGDEAASPTSPSSATKAKPKAKKKIVKKTDTKDTLGDDTKEVKDTKDDDAAVPKAKRVSTVKKVAKAKPKDKGGETPTSPGYPEGADNEAVPVAETN